MAILWWRIIGIFSIEEISKHKCDDDHHVQLPVVDNQDVPQFIFDCDPAGMIATGLDVDDDLTLINAITLHKQGSIRILGITITGGNAPVDFTYFNALELVRRRAGLQENAFRIYKGGLPLSSTTTTLASTSPSKSNMSTTHQASDASKFIVDTIMNAPEKSITVLSLGPLTNIAAAYTMEPNIAQRVKRIVSMGGTLSATLPHDLNIRTDPIAASIVWNDMDCPKVILPVETCVQAVFGPRQLEQVEDSCFGHEDDFDANARPLKSAIICSYWTRLTVQRHIMPWLVNRRYIGTSGQQVSANIAEGFILWDLVALWAAIRPDLFTNWTYWDVKLLTYEKTNFYTRQRYGVHFEIEPSPITNERYTHDQQGNRQGIMVPMTLKSEQEFLDLVLNHLFLFDESTVVVSEPLLSVRQSLGTLPQYLFTTVTLVMSTVLCFVCIRLGIR